MLARFAIPTIASVALFLVTGGSAGAMQVTVEGNYTFEGLSVSFGAPTPGVQAYSNGLLYYSATGDFDRTGEHGDPNFAGEGGVTLSLDGTKFMTDVDFNQPNVTLFDDPMNFGRDQLEGIFMVPKSVLNDILSDGVIHFGFGFDPSIGLSANPMRPFAASLVFSSVPEPTSIALFAVGAIACGGSLARRHRRRKAA